MLRSSPLDSALSARVGEDKHRMPELLDESKQTRCTRCNKRYSPDEYTTTFLSEHGAQWLALSEDDRLPNQSDSLGYCERCKQVYYAENRELVFKAYQDYLDSFPTPAYIYGLIDPRNRLIYYIGRSFHLARRIREHRQDETGQDARASPTSTSSPGRKRPAWPQKGATPLFSEYLDRCRLYGRLMDRGSLAWAFPRQGRSIPKQV